MTCQRCSSAETCLTRTMPWLVIIQRHNEIRDYDAEILQMVCTAVEMEPFLQELMKSVTDVFAQKKFSKIALDTIN